MQKINSIFDIMSATMAVEQKLVIDIGSGTGGLVRWLARRGARAAGVECYAQPLITARSKPPVENAWYIQGNGEYLPLPDMCADFVIFSFSLHHIPVALIDSALSETRRVLKPDGLVVVLEPLPEGSGFEMLRLIDDETEERQYASRAIHNAERIGLEPVNEQFFSLDDYYADEQAMLKAILLVDAARRVAAKAREAEFKRLFYQVGVATDRGYRFEDKLRLNILRRLPG